MKKDQIQEIRLAVTAHRGGLEAATDTQIMAIWRSLPEAVQKQYMETLKPERKPHAKGHGSKSAAPGGAGV